MNHVACIVDTNPEECGNVFILIKEMYKNGWEYTENVSETAIQTHNYPLLTWIVHQDLPIIKNAGWVAVHSRNRSALRHIKLDADHFEEVALHDDITFLDSMWNSLSEDKQVDLQLTIPHQKFNYMLTNTMDKGEDGFCWLANHHLIEDIEIVKKIPEVITRYGKDKVANWN